MDLDDNSIIDGQNSGNETETECFKLLDQLPDFSLTCRLSKTITGVFLINTPPSINDRVPNSNIEKNSLINDRRNSARAARKCWHLGDFRRGYPYETTWPNKWPGPNWCVQNLPNKWPDPNCPDFGSLRGIFIRNTPVVIVLNLYSVSFWKSESRIDSKSEKMRSWTTLLRPDLRGLEIWAG